MKIYTYPKIGIEKEFEDGVDNSENALISILSSVDTPLSDEVKNSYAYVLELRFDDVSFNIFGESCDKNSDFYGMKSFDDVDYGEIYSFINSGLQELNFDGKLKIHCTAGVSRSGSVAVGVSLLMEDKFLYEQVLKDNTIRPNQLVLSYFIQDATDKNTYFFDIWDMCTKLKGDKQ